MSHHFLCDTDLTPEQQGQVLDVAVHLKAQPYAEQPLAGPGAARRTVALLFDKTSTRTRISFAAGVGELGGLPLVMGAGETQLGHKESIPDTARVLERQVTAIVWRTFAHENLVQMAAHSRVPVINALSDDYHPCQLLADLLTVREHKGRLQGLTLSYLGDGANNMAHSYLLAGATAGMHIRIGAPQNHQPRADILAVARERAQLTGGSVMVTDDPILAVAQADVVATDTWTSMGKEGEKRERKRLFTPYRVDEALMREAPQALVLHCLPAYRGQEVTGGVLDGPQSTVWDEAENRRHAQKALLVWLLRQREPRGADA